MFVPFGKDRGLTFNEFSAARPAKVWGFALSEVSHDTQSLTFLGVKVGGVEGAGFIFHENVPCPTPYPCVIFLSYPLLRNWDLFSLPLRGVSVWCA